MSDESEFVGVCSGQRSSGVNGVGEIAHGVGGMGAVVIYGIDTPTVSLGYGLGIRTCFPFFASHCRFLPPLTKKYTFQKWCLVYH